MIGLAIYAAFTFGYLDNGVLGGVSSRWGNSSPPLPVASVPPAALLLTSGDFVIALSSQVGTPVEGVQVYITGPGEQVSRLYTSSKGEALLKGVGYNWTTYTIRLENGYNPYPIEPVNLTVTLTPQRGGTYRYPVNVSVIGSFQPLGVYVPLTSRDGTGAWRLRRGANYRIPFTVGAVGGSVTCPKAWVDKGPAEEIYAYKVLGSAEPTGSLLLAEGLRFPDLRPGEMNLMEMAVKTGGSTGRITLFLDDFCGEKGRGVGPLTADFVVE